MPKLRFARKRITEKEVKAMIERAEKQSEKALVAFLYITGCRISEVLQVKVRDFRQDGDIIYIRVIVLKRRLDYDHILPIGKNTPFLIELIRHRKNVRAAGGEKLFPFNRFKAWRILHKLDEDVWPHVFRHNRLNSLLESGASPHELQIWAGWKYITASDSYIQKSPHLIRKLAHKIK